MKRSMILLLCLLLCLLPACQRIEPTESSLLQFDGDYTYRELKNGCAAIVNYTGTTKQLTIPATIGRNRSVSMIEDFAFNDCNHLTSVTIPDSVISIGVNPFQGCHNLTQVNVSPDHPVLTVENGALIDKTTSTLICCPPAVANAAYSIPQGVSTIGVYAFYNCDSLRSVTIPSSVTGIGSSSFWFCDSLTDITIPDSVTSIGIHAFIGSKALTSIAIPNSVVHLDNPFALCNRLEQIQISPDHPTLAVVNGLLFNTTTKQLICCLPSQGPTYQIPQGTLSVGYEAFFGCDALTSVIIPDSVTSISNSAFNSCSKLTALTIPAGVTGIGNNAFFNCPSLTLTVERDSCAMDHAIENGIPYTCVDFSD